MAAEGVTGAPPGGAVTSVFGRGGAVAATNGDYTPAQVGVAAGPVTPQTTAGAASADGVAATFSRSDHAHGTPAAGGGGAASVVTAGAIVTAGNITLPDTGGSWSVVAGAGELSVAAAIGDLVCVWPSFMFQPNGSFLDVAVVTGAGPTIKRAASSGTATPAVEGDPSLYNTPGTYRTAGTLFSFEVAAGDLDTGAVRVAFITNRSGGTGGVLFAGTAYPLRWRMINFGNPT